jgi:competence protein ComEC
MKYWKPLFSILILAVAAVWLAVFAVPDQKLHLVFCDVGQGDAILAEVGSIQVLVDGGPDNKVLDCLSHYMPFYDREIEVVVNTHPERDHYGGLVEVFRRYKVDNFLATQLDSGDPGYGVLKNLVGGSGAKVINPTAGSVIRVGLMQLDIVWPSEEFLAENLPNFTRSLPAITGRLLNEDSSVLGAYTTSKSLNDFCIASVLRFKNFETVLSCDLQPPVIDQTISQFLAIQLSSHAAILKVPHHGSKNGLTKEFLDAVDPALAVISVGKNQWGHPNEETLKLLNDKKVKYLRTDQNGDIEIVSDGKNWETKKGL